MSFLLADAARLTNDLMVRGVINTIITQSSVLRYLPFEDLVGTQLTWNRENAASTVAWHAPLDTWATSEGTISQASAALAILGGDADVDNFIATTYRRPNDIAAEVMAERARRTADEFNLRFFTGDSAGGSNQFDGLNVNAGAIQTAYTSLTAALRAWSEGANGATLTLDIMDKFMDAVKPGRPDVIFCSKRSRRKLASLRRASGSLLETWKDMSGRHEWRYDGIPLEVDENITDTQTQGTSTDCSSIYGVKFGFGQGVVGLTNGMIQVEEVGKLETKDATRRRIKWYVNGCAVMQKYGIIRLAGVRD